MQLKKLEYPSTKQNHLMMIRLELISLCLTPLNRHQQTNTIPSSMTSPQQKKVKRSVINLLLFSVHLRKTMLLQPDQSSEHIRPARILTKNKKTLLSCQSEVVKDKMIHHHKVINYNLFDHRKYLQGFQWGRNRNQSLPEN